MINKDRITKGLPHFKQRCIPSISQKPTSWVYIIQNNIGNWMSVFSTTGERFFDKIFCRHKDTIHILHMYAHSSRKLIKKQEENYREFETNKTTECENCLVLNIHGFRSSMDPWKYLSSRKIICTKFRRKCYGAKCIWCTIFCW